MARIRIAVTAFLLIMTGVLPSPAQPLTQPPLAMTPLFRQFIGPQRMKLTIMSGRVVNSAGWQFGNGTSSTSDGTNKEQITFRGGFGMGNTGSLEYERKSPQEDFTFQISSENVLRFRRTPKGSSSIAPVEFSQAPGEPLRLTVTVDGKQQVFTGATIWHLILGHPEESRPLVAVLEQLHPWQLSKTTSTIEAELLKTAGGSRPDRAQWAALVQQLADDQFTRREAADRQLRTAGPAVLGYLQQLDFDQLDAEQQSRIRRMMKSLSQQTSDDRPEQVAIWLSEDPTIWLALLSRPDASVRQAAAKQLVALLGHSIPVDPAADPATQKSQREELRARIEKARPTGKKKT
jgi:hypothetical protein